MSANRLQQQQEQQQGFGGLQTLQSMSLKAITRCFTAFRVRTHNIISYLYCLHPWCYKKTVKTINCNCKPRVVTTCKMSTTDDNYHNNNNCIWYNYTIVDPIR